MPSFSSAELGCRCCGLTSFAPGFVQALQGLRDAVGEPMILTSACRCATHNEAVGGHPRSLHVGDEPARDTGGCCAVDVRAPVETHQEFRDRLIQLAEARGWSVGLHPRFLHLDLRTAYTDLPRARFNY